MDPTRLAVGGQYHRCRCASLSQKALLSNSNLYDVWQKLPCCKIVQHLQHGLVVWWQQKIKRGREENCLRIGAIHCTQELICSHGGSDTPEKGIIEGVEPTEVVNRM